MTTRGTAPLTLVRPYAEEQTRTAPIPTYPPVPDDAVDPARWLEGHRMWEEHYTSVDIGWCLACGSTQTPHCGYRQAAYNLMRGALADPSVLPNLGP